MGWQFQVGDLITNRHNNMYLVIDRQNHLGTDPSDQIVRARYRLLSICGIRPSTLWLSLVFIETDYHLLSAAP